MGTMTTTINQVEEIEDKQFQAPDQTQWEYNPQPLIRDDESAKSNNLWFYATIAASSFAGFILHFLYIKWRTSIEEKRLKQLLISQLDPRFNRPRDNISSNIKNLPLLEVVTILFDQNNEFSNAYVPYKTGVVLNELNPAELRLYVQALSSRKDEVEEQLSAAEQRQKELPPLDQNNQSSNVWVPFNTGVVLNDLNEDQLDKLIGALSLRIDEVQQELNAASHRKTVLPLPGLGGMDNSGNGDK